MSKQFWAVIVAIILVFVGIYSFSGKKTATNSNSGTGLSKHIEGLGKSGVTLVEYGDYECPFCEQYFPTVKEVQSLYNDQIFFQFRNFPLVNAHPNAFAAARAAEAAGLQNKFWEMHDALYEPTNYRIWSTSTQAITYFNQYALQLGLDVTRFKTDFASDSVNSTVNADMAEGNRLGVAGTPSFFIDGKAVQIGNSLDAFKKVIDAEIAQKTPAAKTQ